MKIIGIEDKSLQFIFYKLHNKLDIAFPEDNKDCEVLICLGIEHLRESLFNFRKNGPKFGCDIRLTPYYKIQESFYMDKWGDEIISFTDTLAGYIPLIEKARAVTRNPNLYFGIRIYNNPDSFMLSSLDKMNRIDDNVLISVDNHQYDIAFRKGKY